MKRWGYAVAAGVLLLSGCATDARPVSAGSPVQISRQGGDMGIDDQLVIQPDASWTLTFKDKAGHDQARTGRLADDKVAQAREIMKRPGFAQEISVAQWSAHCVDPPNVVVKVGDRQSAFVECDDPDQKNMN